jgi:hypothetical protein
VTAVLDAVPALPFPAGMVALIVLWALAMRRWG